MRKQILSSVILFFLLSSTANGATQNSLDRGSSLSVENKQDLLTSPDTTFSFGFHNLGTNAWYLSIWFTNSTEPAVVWTANRNPPVNGRGSRLDLGRDGNMVLKDVDGSTVWETGTHNATSAELHNTGNLVLKDSAGNIIWQSFASPTDTLLPLQPLTKDTRLVSAIAGGSLSSGYYTLYFDNDNVLRLIYDGPEISSIYWPNPDLSVYQNGRTNYNSSRRAVLDESGFFRSSDGLTVGASDSGLGIRRRLTMDYDGNLRLYSLNNSDRSWAVTWEAMPQLCGVHGLCGRNGLCVYTPKISCTCPPGYEMTDPSNWNEGCKPKFSKNCHQEVQFVKLPHTDYYGFDLGYSPGVSFESCMKMCLANCTCEGFSYRLTGYGLCYTKSALFNGYTSSNFPGNIYLKLPSNVQTSRSSYSVSKPSGLTCKLNGSDPVEAYSTVYGKGNGTFKWTYFYAFVSALGAVEFLFIFFGWWYLFRNHHTPKSVEEGYKMISSQFRRFSYKELKEATMKFKEELGRGGSGAVYRGVLDDKRVVAVKKLSDVIQREEELWAEVSVIGRINHMNLVRMWGFCSDEQHRLLVYEYVENRSLDKFLFGRKATDSPLRWYHRFKIAIGTARGLAYLHHQCLEWVIHCDVKPQNILLDGDFEAKIADFGLAKLSKRDGSDFEFSRMRGTMGYMAPEWALNLPITAKVDVYSYGVVLLEMVKGSHLSNGVEIDGEKMDMRRFVKTVQEKLTSDEESWVGELVDPRLNWQFNYKQVRTMLEVAISCVEDESSKRPTMDTVAKILLACEEDESPAANVC